VVSLRDVLIAVVDTYIAEAEGDGPKQLFRFERTLLLQNLRDAEEFVQWVWKREYDLLGEMNGEG
jgi:hypothetical protein